MWSAHINKKKLRYEILKAIDKNINNISAAYFNMSEETFNEQIRFLNTEGYITKPLYADDTVYSLSLVKLTEKGEEYLE